MRIVFTLEETFILEGEVVVRMWLVKTKVIRTGTGSHLSAFASEPAGSLFLPLLSHVLKK